MRASIPPAEVAVDHHLVRRLLRGQHPDLADLPLRRIGNGWDNAVYRLGPDLTVRVPRRELGARLIAGELRWLPELSSALPLAVPTPVRAGQPTADYPWQWSVCRYVPGRAPAASGFTGRMGLRAADTLAEFLAALHVPAPVGAPRNPFRGIPLGARSVSFETHVASAPPAQRTGLEEAWAEAVDAAPHPGPDRWIHGDLHGLNVLAVRGRITGVIDFGDLCAGDPATDLAAGWLLLDRGGRERLRATLSPDAAMWSRGRGWALLLGLLFLAHSADSAVNAAIGRRTLGQVLDEAP